jgi:hypothetical protein
VVPLSSHTPLAEGSTEKVTGRPELAVASGV